ncbi:hypothetical protein TNCV_2547631 [Trichonephila clavipes]|nr:hypothetical protein TNCV_2547631 [Trichonephila clavipes]
MTVSRIWNLWVQDVNTEYRAKSQRTFIISSREDRNVIRMTSLVRAATARTPHAPVKNWVRLQDNKCLYDQFGDVRSSIAS